MLAAMMGKYPDELAADMMHEYGVAWPDFLIGRYPVSFVAQLAAQLPQESRVFKAANPDAAWGLEHVLLAAFFNAFRSYAYGMGGKRGQKPKPIGPSYLTGKKDARKVDAQVMDAAAMEKKLAWFAEMAALGKTKDTRNKKGGG